MSVVRPMFSQTVESLTCVSQLNLPHATPSVGKAEARQLNMVGGNVSLLEQSSRVAL